MSRAASARCHPIPALELASGARRSLQVEGRGYAEADGSFRLDQVVTFDDGATEKRTWRLVKLDARTYIATGNRFHLRYRLRKPAI